MSNSGLSIKDETLREVAFGSITAAYAAFGSALEHDAFRVTIFNGTDQAMYISFDGTNDHKKIVSQSGRVWDEKNNDMYRKSGTQYYLKYDSAPASGSIWIEVEYT